MNPQEPSSIVPSTWQSDMARIGSFNLVSWLSLIPVGAYKALTTQCNFAGHAYDLNFFLVPLLLLGWWAMSYLDAYWLLNLSRNNFLGKIPTLSLRSMLNSCPSLLVCLGLLALQSFTAWYLGLAVIMLVLAWFRSTRSNIQLPRIMKRSIFITILYILILVGPGNIILSNSIGAVDCVTSSNVSANMHSLQAMLIQYKAEEGTACPRTWQELKNKSYWKELANPFAYQEPSIINHPVTSESDWPPFIDLLGIRFYFHRQNAGAVSYEYIDESNCKIYGFDGSGNQIRRYGKVFFLLQE